MAAAVTAAGEEDLPSAWPTWWRTLWNPAAAAAAAATATALAAVESFPDGSAISAADGLQGIKVPQMFMVAVKFLVLFDANLFNRKPNTIVKKIRALYNCIGRRRSSHLCSFCPDSLLVLLFLYFLSLFLPPPPPPLP